MQQREANAGKRRHKAKVNNRLILPAMTPDLAVPSTPPQRSRFKSLNFRSETPEG
jgi:hypothetical protein